MDITKLVVVIVGGLLGIINTIILVISKSNRNTFEDIKKDIEKIEDKLENLPCKEQAEKIGYLEGKLNGRRK